MLCKSISFTNFLCFCDERGFVKSFAKMLIVKIHCMMIVFFWISWRNQWRCIFTWRNLIMSLIVDIINARIVCLLSHSMCVNSFIFMFMISKKRFHHIFILTIIDIVMNSIFVKLMMTIFCFEIFQSMKSSKNLKQYSFEFWRVSISFAKKTFEKFKNMMFALLVWSL